MPTKKNDESPKLLRTRRGGTTTPPTFDIIDGKVKKLKAKTKAAPKQGESEGVAVKKKKVPKAASIPIAPPIPKAKKKTNKKHEGKPSNLKVQDKKSKSKSRGDELLHLEVQEEEIKECGRSRSKAVLYRPPEAYPKNVEKLFAAAEDAWQAESKAFSGIKYLDQVHTLSDKKLKAMTIAVKDATDRQEVMRKALNKWTFTQRDALLALPSGATTLSKHDESTFDAYKKGHTRAMTQMTMMLEHIPAAFKAVDETNLVERLLDRQTASKLTQNQRREKIDELVKGDDVSAKAEKLAFKGAISASIKSDGLDFDTVDPFFNKPVKPIGSAALEKVYAANTAILKRIRLIRDYGGTNDDVEKALVHIPPGYWPNEAVEDTQAWRKVERALQEERVKEMMDKANDLYSLDFLKTKKKKALTNLLQIVQQFGALKKRDGFTEDEGAKFLKVAAELQGYKELLASCKQAMKADKGSNKGAVQKFVDGLSVDAAMNVEARILSLVTAIGGAMKLGGGLSIAGQIFVDCVPFFGIYAAGLDTVKLAHAVRLVRSKKNMTQQEIEDLRSTFGCKDKALINAFENEVRAHKTNEKKRAIELTGKTMSVSGGSLEVTGVLTPAGTVIKYSGMGIYYGSKLVFAKLDKKKATKAAEMLMKARAGDRKAQVNIFKNAAKYAKMYIAMGALGGDHACVQFIENRGISADLEQNPLALKTVRELLMAHAEQHDNETRLGLMRNFGRTAIPLGKYIGFGK